MRSLLGALVLAATLTACGGGEEEPEAPAPAPLTQAEACQQLAFGDDSAPVQQAVAFYAGIAGNPEIPTPDPADVDRLVEKLQTLAPSVPAAMKSDVDTLAAGLVAVQDGDTSGLEDFRSASLEVGRVCADYL